MSVSHPLHSTGAATLHKQTRVAKFTRLHLAYNNCCKITSQAKISHLLDYCYSTMGEIWLCTDKGKLITFGHALKFSLFIMSLMFGSFLVQNQGILQWQFTTIHPPLQCKPRSLQMLDDHHTCNFFINQSLCFIQSFLCDDKIFIKFSVQSGHGTLEKKYRIILLCFSNFWTDYGIVHRSKLE